MDSNPNQGALARGGSVTVGTLTALDNSTSTVTPTWSATESAWASAPLAPGGLVDGFENVNGGVLTTNATR